MNRRRAEQLLDTAARRRLTPDEQADWDTWLDGAGPERTVWGDEMRLNRVLGTLIRIPVSSNFTSRVLAALDQQLRADERVGAGRRPWTAWARWRWQWAAGSVAVLAVALVVLQESPHVQARREVLASAEVLAGAGGLPSVGMLQDFDAIYALPGGPLPSVTEFAAAFDQPVP